MENKKYTISIPLCALVMISIFLIFFTWFKKNSTDVESVKEGMEEDITARMKWMQKTLSDPLTGIIPEDIRQKELLFAASIPYEKASYKSFGQWVQQGPFNVGGRTRAFAIDINNENTFVAGSAMGGIWRTINSGNNWKKCEMSPEIFNISYITQDPRANKKNIWYAGTGEMYGGNIPGAYYAGNGMYKSTDGGITWAKVGTYSIPLGGISNSWSAVHSVVVNPAIDTADVVFVANFDGIFRSMNGGQTWNRRRGGTLSGYSYWSDVKITKTGIIYATLSKGGSHAGIWRSTDNGNTWVNITPTFADLIITNRIVIGIASSDENQIYFVANTPGKGSKSFNFEGKEEWNSLWKYTFVSGDGSGTGGVWEDRSVNLPKLGGAFGDFISQSSYCMAISVKPDDANTVFLGGTNLYRSTDAFATSSEITWMGGYLPGTFLPDFKLVPQHHPDQHGVIFFPSNSKKMISIHDGGISFTRNNMASQPEWISLNNGYLTTQFYSVAIDHQSTSNVIIGGLQDNGTLFTNSPNTQANWSLPLSYDGSFCYIAPNSSEYYMSIQQGRVMRLKLDANGAIQQFARVDPKGVDKNVYQFINPFTPDANDWKIVYIPAGNIIWRNKDVTAIPLQNQPDSTSYSTNWQSLVHTILPNAGDEISAILSSKLEKDVLYYASSGGKLFRLKNASDTSSIPENIAGSNFPGAYINCIAQHPFDSNKLYVVFTNYGILSVFYTSDGGNNWSPISGNLEQAVNGTGNGPSCRWITLVPVQDSIIYFLGTSTGLYATKLLDGTQTQWSWQAYGQIKNNIVTMMDYRVTDGLLAVATYGAGMFTTKITSLNEHTGISQFVTDNQLKIYPNPATKVIYLEMPDIGLPLKYEIYSETGNRIKGGKISAKHEIDISDLSSGKYYLLVQQEERKYTGRFIKE